MSHQPDWKHERLELRKGPPDQRLGVPDVSIFAQSLGLERPSRESGKKVIAGVAAPRVEDMQLLARLAETGGYRPVIDRSYPLKDAAEAHAHVATGRKRGSVVLSVSRER